MSILIAYSLQWSYRPERRPGSWLETIESRRQELDDLLESGTLKNHALQVLDEAFSNGRRRAIAETRLPASTYPEKNPYSLDDILSMLLESDPT